MLDSSNDTCLVIIKGSPSDSAVQSVIIRGPGGQ